MDNQSSSCVVYLECVETQKTLVTSRGESTAKKTRLGCSQVHCREYLSPDTQSSQAFADIARALLDIDRSGHHW